MKCTCPGKKRINFHGNEDRQIVAQLAFPILIELAHDENHPTITYGRLADRIGIQYMPGKLKNPKKSLNGRRALWMRLPLGCIWHTLFELQKDFDEDIPYLTTIVVNQDKEIPTIFKSDDYGWSDKEIKDAQKDVYCFKRWADVKERIYSRYENS